MEVRRLRTLALETFKTLNDLNPASMKNILLKEKYQRETKTNYNYQTEMLSNTEMRVKGVLDHISGMAYGIWNGQPEEIENETSYEMFREYLNTWNGPKCTGSLCFLTEVNA